MVRPTLETTYTLTLDDLIHANGETNGEAGGGTTGGGTTTRYSDSFTTDVTQTQVQDINSCFQKVRSRQAKKTDCIGLGTLVCKPGITGSGIWSSWKVEIKPECQ